MHVMNPGRVELNLHELLFNVYENKLKNNMQPLNIQLRHKKRFWYVN